jgi:hypothetical protein
MNAILPEELEENTLEYLPNEETVYTVPWAMYADEMGRLWLNGNYSYFYDLCGTLQMIITKKDNNYIVDITQCKDHKWSRNREPGFNGSFNPIAVYQLIK